MIAKEGYSTIAIAGLVSVLLVVVSIWIPGWGRWLLWAAAVFVFGFTLLFFRDPSRKLDADNPESLLVAPADGKVILIQDVGYEPLYLKGPAQQVSIFLSPLNVHVNRIPATGILEQVTYVPGEYLVAWHPKSSERNERSEIGLRHPTGRRILFKQIAGKVARRVVFHVEEGQSVEVGARFGIVKFGSRMDILVPTDVEITVALGTHVRGGETIIGTIPSTTAVDTAAPHEEEAER